MVDGEYQFDPTKLGEYHAQNLRQATYFMEGFAVSVYDYSDALCIIDNTNTQHWEYEKYVEAAKGKTDSWFKSSVLIGSERIFHFTPSAILTVSPKRQFTEWPKDGNSNTSSLR